MTSPHSSNEKIHRKCPLPKVGRLHRKQVRQIPNELLDFLMRILWVMPQTLVWTIFPKSDNHPQEWKGDTSLKTNISPAPFSEEIGEFSGANSCPNFWNTLRHYEASSFELLSLHSPTSTPSRDHHKPQPRCRSWGNTRWAPFWRASRRMDDLSEQIWLWLLLIVELLRIGRTVPILQRPRRPRSHFQSKPSCLIAFFCFRCWEQMTKIFSQMVVKNGDSLWYNP